MISRCCSCSDIFDLIYLCSLCHCKNIGLLVKQWKLIGGVSWVYTSIYNQHYLLTGIYYTYHCYLCNFSCIQVSSIMSFWNYFSGNHFSLERVAQFETIILPNGNCRFSFKSFHLQVSLWQHRKERIFWGFPWMKMALSKQTTSHQ